MAKAEKPLKAKAYGSIPHLPGSRLGPGDHKIHEGQASILTEKRRDKKDIIIVQEKLDGSCVAIAKKDGQLIPLIRAGYRAASSDWLQHRLFDTWAYDHFDRFDAVLDEGERVVGEWLALAHGTRYELKHAPFVAFDIMVGKERLTHLELKQKLMIGSIPMPATINIGEACSTKDAMERLKHNGYHHGWHGALDLVEGAVWRVERDDRVEFMAKYVRPGKQDGCYLPEISGGDPIWNWHPDNQV